MDLLKRRDQFKPLETATDSLKAHAGSSSTKSSSKEKSDKKVDDKNNNNKPNSIPKEPSASVKPSSNVLSTSFLRGIGGKGAVDSNKRYNKKWDLDQFGQQCQETDTNAMKRGGITKHNLLHPDDPIPVPLEELQASQLKEILMDYDAPTIISFGKRRSGKSWFTRDCLELLKDRYPFGLVMSGTAHNGFWQHHIPDSYIYDHYDPRVLAKLLGRQMKLVLAMEHHPELQGVINPEVFVILDDIIHDKAVRYDPVLTSFFTFGRHFKITIFICSQYAKGINPTLRGNCDIVIMYKQRQEIQEKSLFEDFAELMKRDAFDELMKSSTRVPHTCVIMHSEGKYDSGNFTQASDEDEHSSLIKDVYFRYKARDPGDYQVGCQEFWGKERNNRNGDGQKSARRYLQMTSIFDQDYPAQQISSIEL